MNAWRQRLMLAMACVMLAACAPEELPPTPTPVIRPTVIVVTSEGPYFDTFETGGDWLIGSGRSSEGRVLEGQYVLRITEPETLAWTHQTRTFGDGIYEVEATFLGGAESSAYGLMFLARSDLSSFLYAMVTADGRYDIGFCDQGCERQESLIDGFTLNSIILTGYQTNRLRVELLDGELTLLVNGAPVSRLRGIEQTEGLVGLIGESAAFGELEVGFDNLSVVEVAAPTTPP